MEMNMNMNNFNINDINNGMNNMIMNNNMGLNNGMMMNNMNLMGLMGNNLENNSNDNKLIMDLLNQNIQMSNQLAINNNLMKALLQKKNNDNNNSNLYDLSGSIDFFPRYKGKKINVIFQSQYGGINIITPQDCKMKDLLDVFHIKLQMYGKDHQINIDDLQDYLFIFNGHTISLDEERTINEFGSTNGVWIIVSPKGQIGGSCLTVN